MQISLSIKKAIYRDYLKGIFELRNGKLVLTRDHDFGRAIISRISYSRKPVDNEVDHTTVVFSVPASRLMNNASRYYLYLTKDDERKLCEQLELIFKLDMDRYFLEGCKLKMMRKDIVQAFILKRNIVTLIGDNETLKKREYRDQQNKLKTYTQMLLKKVNYLDSQIRGELKPFNPLLAS